jgi:hypothetical protein
MPFKSEKQRKWMWANDPEMAKKWEKEEQKEAVQVDVNKVLKNPKIKQLMRRLGIRADKSKESALKILNYLARNPHALAAIKIAFESVKEERDYKAEYKKYGSSTKAKKYRAELNQYNRKKGTYGNGDGKDASHKGGKIVGFENQSVNRGRAEKSRLKQESVNESTKRQYRDVYSKYYKTYEAFAREVMKLAKSVTKISGDRTDERVILKNFKKQVIPFAGLMRSWNRGQQKNPHIDESVNEAIKPQGYSQLNTMAKHAGIYIRDLLKALRKQDDDAVIREVHFLAAQFTTMEKMLKDKKWNAKYSESVNEEKVLKFTDIKDRTLEKHLNVVTKKVGATIEKISGGFKVSGDMRALTAVVDYIFDKSIKKGVMKGGGMSKVNLANESAILEFSKYRLGGLLDSKLKKRLERTIKIIGGKVDAVGDDYIKFRMGLMDLNRLPTVIKKLDHNKNVWIGDKYSKNIWDRKRNIDRLESVNEKISKEEWSEYPKYARKLKPYMRRLLKIPVKVRVIKQANHNPWIDVRVARFGKDVIPNDFRKRALKAIGGGRPRDMDNITYGNITAGSVSLKYDQWVKLLGNKVK